MIIHSQGAGTAIGELPPYFMARAARLSGQIDEDEQEIEELLLEKKQNPSDLVNAISMSSVRLYTDPRTETKSTNSLFL